VSSLAERLAEAIELRESGRLEEAMPRLVELRREFPNDARVAVQTAWVHDSLGLSDEAVEHYEAAIAGDLPEIDLRAAYLGLGSTFRAMGRDSDSDRVLCEGIELFPDFLPLRAFHALTEYSLGRPREAVRALLDLLVEASPDPTIQRYRRALTAYAEDLDRSWLDGS
jgi:tetratricopeptide (TPR) repeat protein